MVDVFPRWAGPCEVMNALFKRLRSELGGVELALLQVQQYRSFSNVLMNSCVG